MEICTTYWPTSKCGQIRNGKKIIPFTDDEISELKKRYDIKDERIKRLIIRTNAERNDEMLIIYSYRPGYGDWLKMPMNWKGK